MSNTRTCLVCMNGKLRETVSCSECFPNKTILTAELLQSQCDACGAVSVLSAQHSENLRRLAARKAAYGK